MSAGSKDELAHARLCHRCHLKPRANNLGAEQRTLQLCWTDQRSITTTLPSAAASAAEALLALAGRAVFFCFAGLVEAGAAAAFLLGVMLTNTTSVTDWKGL